jgi:hypothetical protein
MELKLAKYIFGPTVLYVRQIAFATDHKTYFVCFYSNDNDNYVVWIEAYKNHFISDISMPGMKHVGCGPSVYAFHTNNITKVIFKALPHADITLWN